MIVAFVPCRVSIGQLVQVYWVEDPPSLEGTDLGQSRLSENYLLSLVACKRLELISKLGEYWQRQRVKKFRQIQRVRARN